MPSPKGKYTRIRRDNPRAVAICDYSGLLCMHEDLVRQMEYRGNALVWTGFMVNKRFADKPNPQNMTPLLMPDPIPVQFPRPDYLQGVIELQNTIRAIGGTPFSSAGGIAENAFDGSSATSCTQTSPDGNISYNFYQGTGVKWVGIQSNVTTQYTLVVEFSYNNVMWTRAFVIPPQTFQAGQLTWFTAQGYWVGNMWRVREMGGATLDMQEIYFNVDEEEFFMNGAPPNATYITKLVEPALPNSQAISSLSSGVLLGTTATGVISSSGYGPAGAVLGMTGPATIGWLNAVSENAKYIVQEPDASLPNAQALSLLPSGILASTTGTGVVNSVSSNTAGQILTSDGGGNYSFSDPILSGVIYTPVLSSDTINSPSNETLLYSTLGAKLVQLLSGPQTGALLVFNVSVTIKITSVPGAGNPLLMFTAATQIPSGAALGNYFTQLISTANQNIGDIICTNLTIPINSSDLQGGEVPSAVGIQITSLGGMSTGQILNYGDTATWSYYKNADLP